MASHRAAWAGATLPCLYWSWLAGWGEGEPRPSVCPAMENRNWPLPRALVSPPPPATVPSNQDLGSQSLGGGENWVPGSTLALDHTHTHSSQTLPLFSDCRWQRSRPCYCSRAAFAAGYGLLPKFGQALISSRRGVDLGWPVNAPSPK